MGTEHIGPHATLAIQLTVLEIASWHAMAGATMAAYNEHPADRKWYTMDYAVLGDLQAAADTSPSKPAVHPLRIPRWMRAM